MTPGKRIAALRKEKELSGRQLAKLAGISQGLISQIETGYISTISADKMSAIARALGTTSEFLLHGGRNRPSRGATFAYGWEAGEIPKDLTSVQFYIIPSVTLQAVLHIKNNSHKRQDGPVGGLVNVERSVAIDSETVRQLSLDPRRLISVENDSEAMLPRIAQGDSLIVDLDDTGIVDGKIYLITVGGAARVIRAFSGVAGVILLKPDNPTFPSLEVAANDVRVIGRVAVIQTSV